MYVFFFNILVKIFNNLKEMYEILFYLRSGSYKSVSVVDVWDGFIFVYCFIFLYICVVWIIDLNFNVRS